MSESERIALAARLHVALRRKHGRVTDTEWMATNAEYAAEIVRMTRAHAADTKDEELTRWRHGWSRRWSRWLALRGWRHGSPMGRRLRRRLAMWVGCAESFRGACE